MGFVSRFQPAAVVAGVRSPRVPPDQGPGFGWHEYTHALGGDLSGEVAQCLTVGYFFLIIVVPNSIQTLFG